jgi:hypothetical protein
MNKKRNYKIIWVDSDSDKESGWYLKVDDVFEDGPYSHESEIFENLFFNWQNIETSLINNDFKSPCKFNCKDTCKSLCD